MALPPPEFATYLAHVRSGASPDEGFSLNPTPPRAPLTQRELAAAVGWSLGYVTQLEQGRAKNPSERLVEDLAAALQLTQTETEHLHALRAAPRIPNSSPETKGVATAELADTVDEFARLEVPAAVVTEAWDVVHANRVFVRLFRGVTDRNTANILKWLFFAQEARVILRDWEREARLTVAWLRWNWARRPRMGAFPRVLDSLSDSPEFAGWWGRQELARRRHTSELRVRDLDTGQDLTLRAAVLDPDPTVPVQLFQAIPTAGTSDGVADAAQHQPLVSAAGLGGR